MRLNPCEIRLKQTWGNSEKLKFLFGWRGPLVMIFGGVGGGVRRARWGGVVEQEGQIVGMIGAGEGLPGARWGSRGAGGQIIGKGGIAGAVGDGKGWEGQMAVAVGQWGAGGEWQGARWGRDSGGQEGQMAGDGVDNKVQESQMPVTGGGGGKRRVEGGGRGRSSR